jgi:dipeptidyl aminopeptidase/acylaminoacyl peptidase
MGIAASGAVTAQEGDTRLLTVADAFRVQSISSAVVAPDDAHVAYVVGTSDLDGNKGASAVWMVPTAGGEARRMTGAEGSVSAPKFSPDGRWLSFLTTRGEGAKQQVWGLDLGGGEAQQITDVKQGVRDYAWAPDAARLALIVRDAAPERDEGAPAAPWVVDRLQFKQDYRGYLDRLRPHLYIWDIAARSLLQLTRGDFDHSSPTWSPDGSRIAFVSNRTAEPDANYNTDVWVVEASDNGAGAALQVSTGDGPDSEPTWSPDGERLAWLTTTRPDAYNYALEHVAIGQPGAAPRVLTEQTDRNIRQIVFDEEGEQLLGVLQTEGSQHWIAVDIATGSTQTLWGGDRRVEGFVPMSGGDAIVAATTPGVPTELWRVDRDGEGQPLTSHNAELLSGLRMGRVIKEVATAPDGTQVDTLFTFPPDASADQPLPAILWIHGGPSSQDDFGWDFQRQIFAANGYLVIQPNYRGSHGYGQEFALGLWQDWGGPERIDSMAAVDHAIQRGWADPDRLGVGGWSYGGITTNAIITNTNRFSAAISGAGAALWVASYGHDQYQRWYETELGLPWENRELWETLSPYNRVDQIETPTLWVGGEKDWNVPILHSEIMYQAMRRMGRETLLVVYPDQGHWGFPPVYERDLYYRFLGWYGRYLKADDSLWPTASGPGPATGDAR